MKSQRTNSIPRRARLGLACVIVACVSFAPRAYGQSCNGNGCSFPLSTSQSTLTVPYLTHLQVSSTVLALNAASANVRASEYSTGNVESAPVSMTVWSTAAWVIKVSGTSNTAKLIGDFSFAGNTANACPSAAAYQAMTATATTANGFGVTTSTPNAGVNAYLCVKTALSWTGDPATTTIHPNVFVTVSSP